VTGVDQLAKLLRRAAERAFSMCGRIGAITEPSHISHAVAPTTNKTYTANFTTQYYLTMSLGTGGTVSPASGWKNSGAAVFITAKAAIGYTSTGWTGSGTGSYTGST